MGQVMYSVGINHFSVHVSGTVNHFKIYIPMSQVNYFDIPRLR